MLTDKDSDILEKCVQGYKERTGEHKFEALIDEMKNREAMLAKTTKKKMSIVSTINAL